MSQSNQQYQQWMPHSEPTNLFEAPTIIGFNPLRGQAGDPFMVSTTLNNLNSTLIKIAFGTCIVPTHFTVNSNQSISFHSQVPVFQATSTPDRERVPIYLVMIREGTEDNVDVIDSWFAGYFAFSNVSSHRRRTVSHELDINAKRSKTSGTSPYMPYQPNYLPYMPLSSRVEMDPTNILSYPTYRTSDPQGPSTPTSSSQLQFEQPSSQFMMPMLPNSGIQMRPPNIMPNAPSPIMIPSPHFAHSSSSHASMYSPQQAHPIQPLPTSQSQSHQNIVPIVPALPPHMPIPAGSRFPPPDPFANVLSNATLSIEGDLNEMMQNWTEEEVSQQRRLVQFWRKQQGTQSISVKFNVYRRRKPKDPPDFVISCIYWAERGDYYVTSVDCLSLLQYLIGVVFTVEEKNRVRRNLEGFEPETISKHKDDTAEFFRLVMGFPKPKPRNIEKDLKVFKWERLSEALQKIVSKFTASYSTTQKIITDDIFNNNNNVII
ncbi:Putative Developmental regulator medusa [Rhizopus microsporus]|nr:Putative Developmental regulator medusa [Rhizopus microsporus]